ncbi:MAG TPA: hypothetical protein VIT65_11865 [Microlunatus sp.]
MPDHLALDHLALDDLADLAVGELPVDASVAAEEHLAVCGSCRADLAELSADLETISGQLAALPTPTLPVTVAAQLDRVLAGEEATVVPFRRSAPLKAPASASYVKQTGVVRLMLAAAAAAAVVGFGGYVLSASAGLNEPSALSPTQVHQAALAEQAKNLAQNRDLDPHLFSAAWRCARQVTAGRITGITPVYVAGEENYLVSTRASGRTYATLVTGCGETPTSGERVELSE